MGSAPPETGAPSPWPAPSPSTTSSIQRTARASKRTAAVSRTGPRLSKVAPNKAAHLPETPAVEGRDGKDRVAGELPADGPETLLGPGKVHFVGQNRVAAPHLRELGYLIVHLPHRGHRARGPRRGRVDEVQDDVRVPHRGQGLGHGPAHFRVGVDAVPQAAGV